MYPKLEGSIYKIKVYHVKRNWFKGFNVAEREIFEHYTTDLQQFGKQHERICNKLNDFKTTKSIYVTDNYERIEVKFYVRKWVNL